MAGVQVFGLPDYFQVVEHEGDFLVHDIVVSQVRIVSVRDGFEYVHQTVLEYAAWFSLMTHVRILTREY